MSEENKRRRQHPRVETEQPVWVEGQEVRLSAQARNMSRGGMFVVSDSAGPAVGSTLEIKFEDPEEGTIQLQMEVVWSEGGEANSKLGLRALGSQELAAFERVVTRYEDEQGVGEPTAAGQPDSVPPDSKT